MGLQEHGNQFIVRAALADGLADRLLQTFQQELHRLSARKLDMSGDTVSFAGGGFRFVSNWNLLVPISRGKIVVMPIADGVTVRYQISFRELIVVATIMILAMAVIFCGFEGRAGLASVAFFVPVGWLWLVGMNIVIAIPRFNCFVKRCAKMAGATEIHQITEPAAVRYGS